MIHPLVLLARQAVTAYVTDRRTIGVPGDMDRTFTGERAGVFVCLKVGGALRGCIGTFLPAYGSIAEETIRNAIAAATQDPRFPPVSGRELDKLEYTVDVLSAPEEVGGPEALDPRKYGIIVSRGARKGLLLPDLEGVDSVEEQISIAKMKAGIMPGEPVQLFRFRVDRYH